MTPNDIPSSDPVAASPTCTPLTAGFLARAVSAGNLDKQDLIPTTWLTHGYVGAGKIRLLTGQLKSGKTARVFLLFDFFADIQLTFKLHLRHSKAETASHSQLGTCAPGGHYPYCFTSNRTRAELDDGVLRGSEIHGFLPNPLLHFPFSGGRKPCR